MATTSSVTVVEDGGLGALITKPGQSNRSFQATAEILQATRDLLLERIDVTLLDPVAPARVRNPAVLQVLRAEIGAQIERGAGPLRAVPIDEASLLLLFRDALGWGPAQPYLDDERIQEVKIIGDRIMVQEDGADFVVVPERFRDSQQALDRALLLASRLNVPLDHAHPQGTLPLSYGTRMHVTVPPCTPEHAALICIRRGRHEAWTLDDVLRRGACDQAVAELLLLFARAQCSFLIAGETGSGKTALLEALVNSWPGEPHVITIEDNTLEISVQHAAWTRELVQTAHEPNAFGRAAKEVLRQTPSVVAPGEIRAAEAGAILAVAVSGHAIITTLHAKSALQAVNRFADCAALPDAYSYAGRRDNALEDACDNLEVVIHVEKLGGRRFVSELVLLDGVETQGGRLRPRVVPLVELVVGADGELRWKCAARVVSDCLAWIGDTDRTPASLTRKLRLLNARGVVRAAPTTRAAIIDATARSAQLVQSGQITAALALLARVWADRHDPALLTAARHALDADLARLHEQQTAAERLVTTIQMAISRGDWQTARATLAAVLTNLTWAAAFTPSGGWQALEEQIETGLAADRHAAMVVETAQAALDGGRPHDALALLGSITQTSLAPDSLRACLQVRRSAVATLVESGEASRDALAVIDAQIQVIDAQIQRSASQEERDDAA